MTATGESSGAQPLTLAELAQLAGVSAATVSKVVNGRSAVAPETRALVEGLIREHGYRRQRRRVDPAAAVELVFHELAGEYPTEIIRGVGQVAREHQLTVSVSELQGSHVPESDWLEGVLSHRPTGVIAVFSGLTDLQRERLARREIPLVLLDPTGEPGHRVPSVGAGNWTGGLSATRHLLELGHRRIAIITGPDHALSSRARLDGYRAALDTERVPVDPELICRGDFQIEDGLACTHRLLRLPDPPTAIFTCNDGEALGVYRAAHELGLRIPDDLSVVGFDDLPSIRWAVPPLTTIRQPLTEMAMAATRMVVALAQGAPLPRHRVEFATELIVRGSTAPPKPR
ncbi:LacI family DNA-binding transcriptional regulator [Nonomuraea jabiensis]|uniref:LacI family xylobiose transport system transcriptional regulator n=1 Tax=Nonomuraea jabiensis TaxID=882448 RepID=A0A7W9LHW9_9ACTN|nr:LacI family DNA-binding transcriptional regulator [Nonomuraea jabiensis]MBB5784435.1 LacI family xylobiose transport system transcriptional regulator [Nonomuraea jabiensis]